MILCHAFGRCGQNPVSAHNASLANGSSCDKKIAATLKTKSAMSAISRPRRGIVVPSELLGGGRPTVPPSRLNLENFSQRTIAHRPRLILLILRGGVARGHPFYTESLKCGIWWDGGTASEFR